jgi:hypothetical protein
MSVGMVMCVKDSIAAKIRALLAKTVENGATEHEAHAAAAKARQLMDEYQLSLSEVELREEGLSKIEMTFPGRLGRFVASDLQGAVSAYTETRTWANYGNTEHHFLGLASDIIFAEWLLPMLVNLVCREANTYGRARRDRSLKMHFAGGMARRISARMHVDVRLRKMNQSTGKGLVVAKNAMINARMNELGIKLAPSSSEKMLDPFAAAAGAKAGDGVRWDKPIETNEALRLR